MRTRDLEEFSLALQSSRDVHREGRNVLEFLRNNFDLNQEDLQLVLFNGSAHDFDRQDPSLFQKSTYERYEIRLEGIGSGDFVQREEDSYYGDREQGICDLEEVVRDAKRNEELAARRAAAAERNGLRALIGLQPVEPRHRPPRLWHLIFHIGYYP